MENPKIINDILNEWAMRSHDGLVSGHDTPENMIVLNEILSEYGLEQNQVDGAIGDMFGEAKKTVNTGEDYEYLFKVSDPNKKDKAPTLISIGHPDQEKYPDYPKSQKYNGPHDLKPEQYRVANDQNINNAIAASEKDPVFQKLRNVKKVSLANVRKLKEIFETFENKSLINKYRRMYDTIPTIEEALDIYSGKKYPEFQQLINKIDDNKFAGAGRGEMPIVFLLQGASSGGNRKMDIIFAEFGDKEGGVEVKEVSGGTIAISAPTLDKFSNSKFNIAIHELALAANKEPKMKDFMLKILKDVGVNNGGLYPNVGENPNLDKHETAINAFFEDPKVGEVSQFLLDSIFIISEKILRQRENPDNKEKESIGSVEIDIGNKHREFKVPDDKVPELNAAIDSAQGEKTTLNVPISPKDEEGDEVIAERAMKLSFFRENWDQARVQNEIMKLIVDKYTKMIIIDKRKKQNNAYLYDKAQIRTLEFIALGFGKLFMYVPGMGRSKAQASGDVGATATATPTATS
jgi:hypothetical protein